MSSDRPRDDERRRDPLASVPLEELARLGIAPWPRSPSEDADAHRDDAPLQVLCAWHPNDVAKRDAAMEVLRAYAPGAKIELVQPFDDPELRVQRVLEARRS